MTKKEIVLENILHRRNTKPDKFTGEVIPDEIVHEMLSAAHWAPTHGNTEPWQFNVFTGEGKEVLASFLSEWMTEEGANEIKQNKVLSRIQKSSHIISIGMKRGSNPKIPEIEELLSTAMAVQNMWLIAGAHDIGAYWSSGEKAFTDRMRDFIGLEPGDRSLGFLYLGSLDDRPLTGHRLTTPEDHVNWIRSK